MNHAGSHKKNKLFGSLLTLLLSHPLSVASTTRAVRALPNVPPAESFRLVPKPMFLDKQSTCGIDFPGRWTMSMLSMNGINCIRNLSRRKEYEVFADDRSMPGIAEWSVNTLKGEPSKYWRRRPTAQARQAISNSEAS